MEYDTCAHRQVEILMNVCNLTSGQMAKTAGVTKETIDKLLRDKKKYIRRASLLRIARTFNVSTRWLMYGEAQNDREHHAEVIYILQQDWRKEINNETDKR